MCLQIPGGWLADRFGGRWFCGGSVLLSAVIALLTPVAARTHIVILVCLRVIAGLGQGAFLPSVQTILAQWSQPKYRSAIVAINISGFDVGAVAGMLLAGVLCEYGFAGGWPSVFYVFGMAGCLWTGAWFLLCYSSPSTHPWISNAELQYWEREIGTVTLTARPPTPWTKILTSGPVWALTAVFFAESWGYLTLQMCVPLFAHDVLGYDIVANGFVSALPFLILVPLSPSFGCLADWLRAPGRLSTNLVRKAYVVIGSAIYGCSLIFITYTGCIRAVAVLLICLATSGSAFLFPACVANLHDLAPLHAGKLAGLTKAVSALAAIGGPLVVGEVTEQNSTREQWRVVFFLAAAVYAVAAVVFVVFGSVDRQSWAEPIVNDDEMTLQIADETANKTADSAPGNATE